MSSSTAGLRVRPITVIDAPKSGAEDAHDRHGDGSEASRTLGQPAPCYGEALGLEQIEAQVA